MKPTIVLVGSPEPLAIESGIGWRAVEGGPAHLRVWLLGPDEAPPSASDLGPHVTVWSGTQIDSLEPAGDPSDAGALLAVGQEAAPGHEAEFNAWLDEEHVPGLGGVPGTLAAHRYRSDLYEPAYYAVYHLRDRDVRGSEPWVKASKTELSAAMKPHARKRVSGFYVPD